VIAVSFYDPETGLFTGEQLCCPLDSLPGNTLGRSYVIGLQDHRCRRVDLQTGEVVDFIPPQPSEAHEWDGKRWRFGAAERKRIRDDKNARFRIAKLEAAQHRRVRELLAANDPMLKRLDEQIEEERTKLIGQTDAT